MKQLIPIIFLTLGLCGTGCVTSRVIEDSKTPEIEITQDGSILFRDKTVPLNALVRTLRKNDIAYTQEINILTDPKNPPLKMMKRVAGVLVMGGYKRTIYVSTKHGESTSEEMRRRPNATYIREPLSADAEAFQKQQRVPPSL